MKINSKQNNVLFNNSYKHYYFWESRIIKETPLWEGYFDEKPITTNSKIIYTGILNYKKNIFHYSFAAYPSIYNLLGFLQHVFLPTAFFSWFDYDYDGFYIPLSKFDNVVNEVIENNTNIDSDLVNLMKNSYCSLNNLWDLNENLLSLELKSFCNKFNSDWEGDSSQRLFLMIFDNPSEVFDFIKSSIGWSDFNEFIEEEISMNLDTLKFTCDNAIIEPLLNKKFIDILNKNIPILF